jgi:transcriptional repressor NrdR
MFCPTCDGETGVIDSRLTNKSQTTRRRRKCKSCGARFTTLEYFVDDEGWPLDVVTLKQAQEIAADIEKLARRLGAASIRKLATRIIPVPGKEP